MHNLPEGSAQGLAYALFRICLSFPGGTPASQQRSDRCPRLFDSSPGSCKKGNDMPSGKRKMREAYRTRMYGRVIGAILRHHLGKYKDKKKNNKK
jgi:hypothetical protein